MSGIRFNEALQDEQQDQTSGLMRGLRKTRDILTADIRDLVASTRQIDDDVMEEIETRLLMADVGVETTRSVIDAVNRGIEVGQVSDVTSLIRALRDELVAKLTRYTHRLEIDSKHRPTSILMVGVNGAGKTTTTGKLAKRFQRQGYGVMLAAGDTFRAAAVEQLEEWGRRNHVEVLGQGTGADSASVSFDALSAAKARGTDVLIADTAGRLHTQGGLMDELTKIKRVMKKVDESAPTETLLVVDATQGQNALNQAREFHRAIDLTGLIVTKLDGTAKGGIIFAISHELGLPIRFIGVGESIDDLKEFKPKEFVHALLADSDNEEP
ncbi:signal recognition particle-docking protein FtsY [gamma proteobacterium HTCC5015]|nr:signal recognition particle-docking protein FtsY [gamma proteobacterium HTCC5015]